MAGYGVIRGEAAAGQRIRGEAAMASADDSQPEGATFTVFLKRRMPAGVYFESSSKPDLYSGVEVKIVMTLCVLC